MRILVTGGAGYVGSVSVERLLAAGHQVTVVDDLSTGHRGAVAAGARLETIPYGDVPAMTALLERDRVEAVLHCGAKSIVPNSVRDPADYFAANVIGGLGLLDALRAVGVARLVFSSTAAVYGMPSSDAPLTEVSPAAPINPYGMTKLTLEGAIRAYGEAYGLRGIALRYFNVAGASERNGEVHDPETHLIPNVLRAAEGRMTLTVYGSDYPTRDGTCIRDYIDVRDLADAHLAALEATAPEDERGGPAGRGGLRVFNLGNGGGYSVLEVLDAAERVTGRSVPRTIGDRRAGDPPVLVASAALADEVLGWRPTRPSLEEMIGSAWAWRRRNPDGYPA